MAVKSYELVLSDDTVDSGESSHSFDLAGPFSVKKTPTGVEVLHRPKGRAEYSVATYPWHRVRRLIAYGESDSGIRE